MKLIKTFTAVAAAVGCLTVTSQATIILSGQQNVNIGAPTGVAPGGAPGLIGAYNNTGAGGNLVGSVSSWVTVGNGFGASDLTFTYLINNTGAGIVEHMTVSGLLGLSVDMTFVAGGGTAPSQIDRNAAGDIVTFDFVPAIPVGVSDYLVVNTSSSSPAGVTTAGILDGSGATAQILAVPEPTTVLAGALLLLPFGASTLRIVRRRTA